MINEMYLAVVYRPTLGAATGLVSKMLDRTRRDGSQRGFDDAVDACEKLAQTLAASLTRYEPDLLGTYQFGNVWCSSLLEYLGTLINGEWQRTTLPKARANGVLATSRWFLGTEAIDYLLPTATRVGAMLGIKEYPTPSVVGMFNRLLSAPFPFVLTQSFAFLTKAMGQSLLQRQHNRMANAGDFAVSQAMELQDALDALTSNEFVMGDHHFSLQVLADVTELDDRAPAGGRLKALNDHVALARSLLADTGMLVAREDLALEAAFWAQLPGNFPHRPRPGADHVAKLCRYGAVSQLPHRTRHRQSLGRCIEPVRHQCSFAVPLFFACQRPARPQRRQPQGYRTHAHLWSHRFRQDRIHRLLDCNVGS